MKKMLIMALLLCAMSVAFAQNQRVPGRAVLYSAICPGGGQLYNHQYLKAGLVVGVQGFLVGSLIYNQNKRNEYRNLSATVEDPYFQQYYLALSKDYKEKVNNNIWWMGITSALSMIDAYVDAHLYDFEAEKEKIRLRFGGDNVSLEFRF